MTDARFGPALRVVLTTPEHSAMMDTIEENLAKWRETSQPTPPADDGAWRTNKHTHSPTFRYTELPSP